VDDEEELASPFGITDSDAEFAAADLKSLTRDLSEEDRELWAKSSSAARSRKSPTRPESPIPQRPSEFIAARINYERKQRLRR
jgi:hypothetical protein